MSRPGNAPGDGDFLGRWSARKLKARAEPAAPLADAAPGSETAPAVPPGEARSELAPELAPEQAPEKSDAEILQELGLPDPDSLVKGDDFKAFMRAGVPARLRNRALRKLWLSDPVLANLDGLNDYDKDFTDAATVMPALKTAYKVGRGFLCDEPAAPAAAEAPPDASAPELPGERAPADPAPAEIAGDPAEAPAQTAASDSGPAPANGGETAEVAEEVAARPRRMRFRFGES